MKYDWYGMSMQEFAQIQKQPEVSVIIPIYNGEHYIGRAIDSVFACKFPSLELILFDDGSSDNSKKIIEEYAKKEPETIRVFSRENRGVANTRNEALELSRGKYILFLDQDDFFDADYIETFYKAIEESGADIVMGGYKRPDSRGRIRTRALLSGKGFFQYITTFCWAKIHRASFLKENAIEFFDNNIGEDVVFCVREAGLTKKVKFIPYIGYNWYYNEDSVSNSRHKGLSPDVNTLRWMEEMNKLKFETETMKEYFLAKIPIYYLLHSGRNSTAAKYMSAYKELFEWLTERFPAFEKNPYLKWGFPGESFRVSAAILLFMLIRKLHLMRLFAKVYCSGDGAA